MGIIEMEEWEKNSCKNIGNALIFKFSGILIAFHLVTILYCLHVHNMYVYHNFFKNGIQGNASEVRQK